MEQMRLAKLMAQRGHCSRRQAERMIEAGLVKVDGELITRCATNVAANVDIELLPEAQKWQSQWLTIVLHKPVGVVSNQAENGELEAWQLIKESNCIGEVPKDLLDRAMAKPWTFAVAGRLDKASRGLLVLSQDGRVVRAITGDKRFAKHYRVRCDKKITDKHIEEMRQIRRIGKQGISPMKIKRLGNEKIEMILRDGRKHQIRRACEQVGLKVTDLFRFRIGDLQLDLPEKSWQAIDPSVFLKHSE